MSPNPFDNRFIDLKSNMDRFIAGAFLLSEDTKLHLKSNMDRFIEFH